MTDYVTDLKQWGDKGVEYPTGYSYADGEPPVDEWDDYFNYNVWADLKHLIDLTNERLDSSTAQRPSTPTDGELYWDGEQLEIYDADDGSWRNILVGGSGKYLPTAGGTMFGDIDFNTNAALNVTKLTSGYNDAVGLEFRDTDGGFAFSDSDLADGEDLIFDYDKSTGHLNLGSPATQVDFYSSADFNGNFMTEVGQFQFAAEQFQPMFIYSDSGTFSIRDADQSSLGLLQYGGLDGGGKGWTIDGGQIFNEGGSFYMGNTGGAGNDNDSYDMVFENEPSGKDFRMHFKRDPEDSSLEGDVGMVFSSNGQGPIQAWDVDSQITYVNEIRSTRDNLSGTPIAQGDLAPLAGIGEIWYDRDADEFRGMKSGGFVKIA